MLQTINGLKTEFSSKLDWLLSAVNSVKGELTSCQKRISETEEQISNAEDDVPSLHRKAESLEEQVAKLTSKLDSFENRSRRSNLRLVNLPEAAEGNDILTFLESWLPDALRLAPPASPIVVERAHRLSGPKLVNGPPRPLIMKFLSYKDKVFVQNAARQMGKILYKDRQVMLFPDISAELHKQRMRFDGVKRRLREMDVQYGIVFPVRLRVTHGGRSYFFDNPSDTENFIKDIQKK
ncbi:LINE-1 retrotransposable element ORF1 protein [Dissostichus eleginoides]|uniref:LINE-1 retrotransposable element ORF1 protein n=1 Tax=Dissostichus eleginoides TaxID=100907 RepID=A0AAD9FA92_DISEL|nr:LINE-1 retrotransposable element ORF1 protein [Dissostichus eleginoides]